MQQPLTIAVDRTMLVSLTQVIKTAWVDIDLCVLGCRERMAVGDVGVKWNEMLQRNGRASWPPPCGHWKGERFVITDGRHEFIAALMHGLSKLFVAWVE